MDFYVLWKWLFLVWRLSNSGHIKKGRRQGKVEKEISGWGKKVCLPSRKYIFDVVPLPLGRVGQQIPLMQFSNTSASLLIVFSSHSYLPQHKKKQEQLHKPTLSWRANTKNTRYVSGTTHETISIQETIGRQEMQTKNNNNNAYTYLKWSLQWDKTYT